MKRVGVGELRDHVSEYVRRAEKGERIIIMNRDREVAVLEPWHGPPSRGTRLLGCLEGTATVVGDIVSPVLPEDEWFGS